MELTHEDRAAIVGVIRRFGSDEDWFRGPTDEESAQYLAGLRAGMERAAILCDDLGDRDPIMAYEVADFIRAAAKR